MLIAFEGIGGAGKTTFTLYLKEQMIAQGYPTKYIKRPNAERWANFQRERGSVLLNPHRLRAFFLEDLKLSLVEAESFEEELDSFTLLDRHWLTQVAYQADDSPYVQVEALRTMFGEPDLWVILEAPLSLLQDRLAKRTCDGRVHFDANAPLPTLAERHERMQLAVGHLKNPHLTISVDEQGRYQGDCLWCPRGTSAPYGTVNFIIEHFKAFCLKNAAPQGT